jgi:hypothetical protein
MGRKSSNVVLFPGELRHTSRLVPLSELRDHYGYSERWWRYRLAEGLPKRKWGGRVRFDPIEVERWMEERYGAQTG